MDDLQRRPGRPRKWSSDAERMRAYRARERERTARLVDPANAPEALIENGKLRERIVQLEAERDRLLAPIPSESRGQGLGRLRRGRGNGSGFVETNILTRCARVRRPVTS